MRRMVIFRCVMDFVRLDFRNLVPRVSHLTSFAPGGKMRDPGNEVAISAALSCLVYPPREETAGRVSGKTMSVT